MLRTVLAIAKQATSTASSSSVLVQSEACMRILTGATFQQFSSSGCRHFSEVPDPDPESNPQPSQRVLEIVTAIENLSVKDLVWLNKELKTALGISDTDLAGMNGGGGFQQAAAPAAAAPEPEPVVEKTEFSIFVESYEPASKIKIIKEVRAQNSDLGLKQAKELVEKLPATIKTGMSKADAEELMKKLEAVGAKVKLD